MDREPEEMQNLGFVEAYNEAYKLIVSCRELFSKIAASLILPLSFLFLAQIQISYLIFAKIDTNVDALEKTVDGSSAQQRIMARLLSEWSTYLLFKGVYLIGVLIFSLLSTSAVVYTVACIYTAKDVSFRKILTVVPKVWKRLMVTFLWSFLVLFIYNFIFLFILLIIVFGPGGSPIGIFLGIIIILLYFPGLIYISIVWHLASVVSVLEDTYGIAAMQKSKNLIRGKDWVVALIYLFAQMTFIGVEFLFRNVVVHSTNSWFVVRLVYAAVILAALTLVLLVVLVVQTVVYFICKSYHHESIDKSSLSDHLEVYMGEYVPLREKDVQLQQFDI
ncbi:hypothetical protein ZOSMA_22G01020 [Zostera marina]|uniref:Transmembrane protein n=1 Tax=Zostera marina TaxID=29655 RepID=A0A0K9PKN9_ZOSMR|nr:hypothetical protein ZOSMA_22G01020 [Zostera marina]